METEFRYAQEILDAHPRVDAGGFSVSDGFFLNLARGPLHDYARISGHEPMSDFFPPKPDSSSGAAEVYALAKISEFSVITHLYDIPTAEVEAWGSHYNLEIAHLTPVSDNLKLWVQRFSDLYANPALGPYYANGIFDVEVVEKLIADGVDPDLGLGVLL